MANKNCLAKIDCTAAYWQVELDNKSKTITTINALNGLYQFNRLPYGIKTAPAIFQKAMEKIIGNLDGIIVVQDDILIVGVDQKSLNTALDEVLTKLDKAGMSINYRKTVHFLMKLHILDTKLMPKEYILIQDL